jgi:hypothetical protein
MTTLADLERHLWNAADELRANSHLKSSAVYEHVFELYAEGDQESPLG